MKLYLHSPIIPFSHLYRTESTFLNVYIRRVARLTKWRSGLEAVMRGVRPYLPFTSIQFQEKRGLYAGNVVTSPMKNDCRQGIGHTEFRYLPSAAR